MTLPPLIFGADVCHTPQPPRGEWAGDLQRLAAAGINTLRLPAPWRDNNPAAGEFDFTDLDERLDQVAAHGLRAIVALDCEAAPNWIDDHYPESRRQTSDEKPAGESAGERAGICLHHAEAQAARHEFIAAIVRRYAAHPALLMWDLWDRPALDAAPLPAATTNAEAERTAARLACTCEVCQAQFILWLQERHGTLGGLNRCWQRSYRRWEEVELPRPQDVSIALLEWRLFFADVLAGELRRRAEIARGLDRQHPLLATLVPWPLASPLTSCADAWLLAEPCDAVGVATGGQALALDVATAAAAGKVVLATGLGAGPGLAPTGQSPPSASAIHEHVRREILRPLGRGAKGFFWGSALPASWLAGATALHAALAREAAFWRHAQPRGPEVGLLFNPANQMLTSGTPGPTALHDAAWQRLHALFHGAQWRVRPLHPRDVAAGTHHELRVIFCPLALLLDAATAEALAVWTRAGGTLIAEAGLGALALDSGQQEPGLPGLGFDALFGVREGPAAPHDAPALHGSESPPLALRGETLGAHAATPLELHGATALATWADGRVALTHCHAGAGHAIYAGTWLSLACGDAARSAPTSAADLLLRLAEFGDPRPRPRAVVLAPTADGAPAAPLRVDWLAHEHQHALLAHNGSGEELQVWLGLPAEALATGGARSMADAARLVEIMEPADAAATPLLADARGGWTVTLPPGASRAWRLLP